jgi:hypothetical protein
MLEFIILVILSFVLIILYNKEKKKLHENYKEKLKN